MNQQMVGNILMAAGISIHIGVLLFLTIWWLRRTRRASWTIVRVREPAPQQIERVSKA